MDNETLKEKLNKSKGVILAPDENFTIIPMPTVEVPQDRYEKLIAAERELELLQMALLNWGGYSPDIDRIKEIFGIRKEIEEK